MPSKRIVIAVASAVAAVVVAGVSADRVSALVAERRLAQRLGCAATGLRVSLGGFPFLTQAAAKTFADVEVRADRLSFRDFPLDDLKVEARDVRLPDGTGREASAGSLSVEAVLGYQDLGRFMAGKSGTSVLANAALGADDSGRLTMTTTLAFRGLDMPATVYAGLAVAQDRLTITPEEIELSGLGLRVPASRLPAAASGPRTVTLPTLPDGLGYSTIAAAPTGLDVVVEGHGLHGRLPENDKKTTCGGTAE